MTDWHESKRTEFRTFVSEHVAPGAGQWDREQCIPSSVIAEMAQRGYLGCSLPSEFSGQNWDMVTFGLLHESVGRGSTALAGVLTVNAMASMVLLKWGTLDQKRRWLPAIATGEKIVAFALTEPGTGSALQSLTTEFAEESDGLVVNGTKDWISCAQFADVFLVFGKLGQHSIACLVPRNTPGLHIEPITELMGFRAAGLAQLHMKDVRVPSDHVVGKAGFALSHLAPVGLHYGRISTACSALGLLRGCVEESTARAAARRVDDKTVGELGMIRSLIARMGTDLEAGRHLCQDACRAVDSHSPEAFKKALIAKYFTSLAAVRGASDAVQIHGASGCHGSTPVSRYYRDAKIMEIIEGTTQIHEKVLGKIFVDEIRQVEESLRTA